MPSTFTRIVNGEIPCYKIAENDDFLAFLDIQPLVEGHTLVIPKREENYIFDLKDEELTELMIFAKKVARSIQKAIPCLRIGVSVIGLEVPHTHVHLIPLNCMDDINFAKPKLKLTPKEFTDIMERITAHH